MSALPNESVPHRQRIVAVILFLLTPTLFAQLPVITSAQEASAMVSNAFTYRIQATNKPKSFTATGLPAGLTLNATSGLIRGTPTKPGTFRVTVTVRNARGVSKSVVIVIKVRSARPVITSALKASGTVGVAFTYQIQASNRPTVFGAAGLPAGLKVNSKTGLISGTPKAAGNFSIRISATNSKGKGSATLALRIKAAVVPAPVITSATSANGTVGSLFTYQITASNSAKSYGATGLPAGLTVNSSTGLISGVPSAAGNSSVRISATNSGGTGNATLLLSVAARTTAPSMITVQGGTLPESSELAGQKVATFQIGKYEVTWGEWKEVRDWAVQNGYTDLAVTSLDSFGVPPGTGYSDNHPVMDVSWYDVLKWCNALSEREGLEPVYSANGQVYRTGEFQMQGSSVIQFAAAANGYRLSTGAEWEWAARGGISSNSYIYSGSNDLDSVAWNRSNSNIQPQVVGSKAPNELGIHDMSGNVWEWCWDADHMSFLRLGRGGSFQDVAQTFTLSSSRLWGLEYYRSSSYEIGFRLARSSENMVTVQGGTLPESSELAGQQVATFQIGKYEVTWDEWKEVRTWAVANGYSDLANVGAGSAGNHPVRDVSWYDAVKWSNARSEKEGFEPVYSVNSTVYRSGNFSMYFGAGVVAVDNAANGYRLPTEAEWEWAARGGGKSQGYTYSGSNSLNAVGWYLGNSSGVEVIIWNGRGTWPVGAKSANELGIHDMSGNVNEWCWDIALSSYRRFRGGGWGSESNSCTITYRDFNYPDRSVGAFRIARNAVD